MITEARCVKRRGARRWWPRVPGTGTALWAAALLAGAGALGGCGSSKEPEAPPVDAPEGPDSPPATGAAAYDPHSVIVRFKPVTGRASLRAIQASSLAKVGATFLDRNRDGVYDRFANIDRSGQMMKLDLPKSANVAEALAQLRRDPAVQYAEPNYVVRAVGIPNDPSSADLYGLNNTGQTGGTADADIDAPEAWDSTTGSSDIVVGVVDTGIDYNHEDLAANMWSNPGEIPGNGLDDDSNGVVDDVHGFNAITGSGDPMDDNAHGSHCAGTIGAVGDNAIGVAGVNWSVSLMALKFLSSGGSGTLEGAIASIDYAIGMRAAGVNLRVLSNSWAGGGFTQGLKDAIEAANAVDILFVAAAGNDFGNDNDVFPVYPASYDNANIVAVAATDHNDGRAAFSNIGATTVDLGAPGVNFVSTVPGDGYASFSGTSMATPHVAGAAALVLSANDTLTTAELKELLLTTGDERGSLAGVTLTGRRLNVQNAVAEAGPPVPRFNLGAGPASAAINQGDSASYQADLSALGGFTGNVSLTVTSSPPITATISVTPPIVAVPGSSTISVATTLATAPGTYALTITGVSGALTRSRTVSLRVRPFGTVEAEFPSTDTPLFIPDGTAPDGIDSVIHVPQSIDIESVEVDVDVTHTWIGDLRITLTSPTGTQVVLHERGTGGSGNDIHQTYVLPSQFTGEQALGDWVMHIDDDFGADAGTLDSWTLRILGAPSAPTFSLGATPGAIPIAQGASGTVAVDVASVNGFNAAVALSASAPPALGQVSVSPSSVTAPGTATLTISPACNTTPGDYQVTVTGESGGTTRTATVVVSVTAFGAASITYPSTDPPLPIPDNNPTGMTSSVTVAESFPISTLTAEVHITHTWIGDLTVELIGPGGQAVMLHNQSGGSTDDIHQTYTINNFNGQSAGGQWTLRVRDVLGGLVGTLDTWTLRATGVAATPPPAASFTYAIDAGDALRASFTDTSTGAGCGGSGITGWAWSFGDGGTSTARNPSHTYATGGTYTVTLTVTDASGATDSASETVSVQLMPVLSIEQILRNRATFEFIVDLTWTGAQGALVELYRDGILVDLPDNDGVHRDRFRRYETAFTWKLCETQSPICSNEVSVVFGAANVGKDGEPTEATIVSTRPDGSSISRLVKIEDIH
jgi:serine protease